MSSKRKIYKRPVSVFIRCVVNSMGRKKRNPLNTAVSLLFKHQNVPFKTINCNILSLKAPNIIYIKTFRDIVVRETFIINKISILKMYEYLSVVRAKYT